MATTAEPSTATTDGVVWHALTIEGAVQELHVEPARGLSGQEAADRLA